MWRQLHGGSNPPFGTKKPYLVSRMNKNKDPARIGGFEADLSACGAGKVSGANDSEGGRASEDSCCAMNKERVGCNGCEAVSTQNEGGEGIPPSPPVVETLY